MLYGSFMFLWVAATSASVASLATCYLFSLLSHFFLAFWACAFSALVLEMFVFSLIFLLHWIDLRISGVIFSLWFWVLLRRASSQVEFQATFRCSHSLFMSHPSILLQWQNSAFSLERMSLKYLPLWCNFRLSQNSPTRRWWPEAVSAPLFVRTSSMDLLNFLQIWSICFFWDMVWWNPRCSVIVLWGTHCPQWLFLTQVFQWIPQCFSITASYLLLWPPILEVPHQDREVSGSIEPCLVLFTCIILLYWIIWDFSLLFLVLKVAEMRWELMGLHAIRAFLAYFAIIMATLSTWWAPSS